MAAHPYSSSASWAIFLESAPIGENREPAIALNLYRREAAADGDEMQKRAKGLVCNLDEWRKLTQIAEGAAICASGLDQRQADFCQKMADRIAKNHPDLTARQVDMLLQGGADVTKAAEDISKEVSKGDAASEQKLLHDFKFGKAKKWLKMTVFLRLLKGVVQQQDDDWKEKHSSPKKGADEGLPPSPRPGMSLLRRSHRAAKKSQKRDLAKDGTPLSRKKLEMSADDDDGDDRANGKPLDLTSFKKEVEVCNIDEDNDEEEDEWGSSSQALV